MTDRFFLFIGSTTADAAVSHLKASGIFYRQKKLESNPPNWRAIVDLIEDQSLIGAVVKLTAENYGTLLQAPFGEVSGDFLAALSDVKHIVFVHESVLTGAEPPASPAFDVYDDEDDTYYRYLADHYFRPPREDVRLTVNQLLEDRNINVVPYRTNAELSVLAARFVEDNETNLLFRMYVPNGRIYAAEADKLLSLFREWLTQVKKQRVRQDGYRTGSGQIYEFFGDDDTTTEELATQFDDFSRFLELCVDEPGRAEEQLVSMGVASLAAADIVGRYGKNTRRLHLDLRHAREARVLSIRQQLESELIDVVPSGHPGWVDVDRMIQDAVPGSVDIGVALSPVSTSIGPANITINQQIIETVQGTVIQGMQGTLNLGPEANELLDAIRLYGGAQVAELESALYELEDVDAKAVDRLGARQRLKGFLINVGDKLEDSAATLLQRYVESKLGV